MEKGGQTYTFNVHHFVGVPWKTRKYLEGVGDHCKYSDNFLQTYDTWQIGLCVVVYP